MIELPRLPRDIIDAFKALVDLTGTLSDAMDELGIVGVIPAYVLPPVTAGTRIVGPALTVRNIQRTAQIHKAAQEKTNTQGETEAHNLAEPGDVLVIEGVMGCSNMAAVCDHRARRASRARGHGRDPPYRRMAGRVVRGFTPIPQWRIRRRSDGWFRSAGCGEAWRFVCADEAAWLRPRTAPDVLKSRAISTGRHPPQAYIDPASASPTWFRRIQVRDDPNSIPITSGHASHTWPCVSARSSPIRPMSAPHAE